jgi:hypothetical protein
MKSYWITSSGGFGMAANWSDGAVPGPSDIAALTASGTYTVIAGADHTVLGLITGPGATLEINNSATFTAAEGTLTGANSGTIAVDDGSTLVLGGALLDNPGTIELNASSDTTVLDLPSMPTIEGGGVIALSDSSDNSLNGGFINVDDMISGAGIISGSFSNQKHGVIDATGTNNPLTLGGEVTSNTGLLEATGTAGLVFSGVVLNSGGTVLANDGSQINLPLVGAFVGGTLATVGSGVINFQSAGVLFGSGAGNIVTNAGNIVVSGPLGSAMLVCVGTIVNTGDIAVSGGTNIATLWDAGGTIDNSGTIALGSNAFLTLPQVVILQALHLRAAAKLPWATQQIQSV